MGSFKLDTIVLKLEKEERVRDLEKCGTEIGEFHHPEILGMTAPYLASSERIHMRSHYIYHFRTYPKPFGVFRSDDRVIVGFESGKMIVMEES